MTKTLSIILVCILSLLIVFLGIFSFLTNLPVGDYKIYYAPSDLIQLSSEFTSSQVANYTIDISDIDADDLADTSASITTIINARLAAIYGYYNNSIVVNEDTDHVVITLPTTTAHDQTTAKSMLESVVATGFVEFVDVDTETYAEDSALMDNSGDEDLFKSASVSQYKDGSYTYYIVTVKLTSTGLDTANDDLDHSSTSSAAALVAVDGTLSYYVYHTEATSSVTIYTSSVEDANTLASYFNNGALPTTISLVSSVEVANDSNALTVVALVFAGLVVLLCGILLVRFGKLSFAAIMAVLLSGILCVMMSGLGYFSLFSYAAAAGFVVGLALLTFCMCTMLSAVSAYTAEKKFKTALRFGLRDSWKKLLIVCGAVLVVGIILWVIPCAVTISLGNALVYSAVFSAICVFGWYLLFALIVNPLTSSN